MLYVRMLSKLAIATGLLATTGVWAQAQSSPPDVKVGDLWTYQIKDGFTSDPLGEFTHRVVEVGDKEITVQLTNKGNGKRELRYFTRDWNGTDLNGTVFEPYYPEYRFPMVVGESWRQAYRSATRDGKSFQAYQKVRVLAYEKVHVPAGDFDAYKLEIRNESVSTDANQNRTEAVITSWYAPAANKYVRRDVVVSSDGRVRSKETTELTVYRRAGANVTEATASTAK